MREGEGRESLGDAMRSARSPHRTSWEVRRAGAQPRAGPRLGSAGEGGQVAASTRSRGEARARARARATIACACSATLCQACQAG